MSEGDKRKKYTDFLPEYQDVLCWGFDYQSILDAYETHDYSIPEKGQHES